MNLIRSRDDKIYAYESQIKENKQLIYDLNKTHEDDIESIRQKDLQIIQIKKELNNEIKLNNSLINDISRLKDEIKESGNKKYQSEINDLKNALDKEKRNKINNIEKYEVEIKKLKQQLKIEQETKKEEIRKIRESNKDRIDKSDEKYQKSILRKLKNLVKNKTRQKE